MGFLDNTGLSYFYNKLKEKFIQSVNGSVPDAYGNVQINQVPLAENLTSPDAQASVESFIYRTSGGSASLESGEANLVFINGNSSISGRVIEQFSATCTGGLTCNTDNINRTLWRQQVTTQGNTVFTYAVDLSNTAVTSWTSSGGWDKTLATYGMSENVIGGIVDYSISTSITSSTISAASVVPSSFAASNLGGASGTYNFVYTEIYGPDPEAEEGTEPEEVLIDSGWYYNGSKVNLSDTYGITYSGTEAVDDVITITWIKGTLNASTVTIAYVPPAQGTITVTTPGTFQSTGFNQFNKNTMVISNASINGSTNKVVESSGNYLCYCPAVGGDHGYAAVSLNNYITASAGMAWCATVPAVGSTVVTTSQNNTDSVTSGAGRFTYSQDGYILVVVSNTSDLMMGCAWTDYITDATAYVAYSAPSQIAIPTIGYDTSTSPATRLNLPTASYGLPRLGNVYDTINFEAATYIKRIGRMAYSSANLAIVQGWYETYGTPYDYDATNIFYVLDGNQAGAGSPVTYALESVGNYVNVSGNPVSAFDVTKFLSSGLSKVLALDGVLHDQYTFTYRGSSQYNWTYDSKNITFTSADGITFSSPASGNKFTLYLPVTSIYQVDDHGTEKFTNTSLSVEAELLYGQNLRDKLRTDVVTISHQVLTGSQQKQVQTNINAGALVFTNKSVATTAFSTNTTYADYGYRASISCSGVTSSMVPQVIFSVTDSESGIFAPVVQSYNGGVYIYANAVPESAITIPTIICWRANT